MKKCLKCGSETTYNKKWYKCENGHICKKCYSKFISNPKRTSEYNKKYNDKRLNFKGEQITLNKNPRRGICLLCGKKIGDKFINSVGKELIIKRTGLHHIRYYNNNVLSHTVELCNSCHAIETWKKRR